MRHRLAIVLLGAGCAGAGGVACGGDDAEGTCPDGGCSIEAVDDVAYTDDALLDVLAPTEPGPWPVIVTAHGKGGSAASMAQLAGTIAAEGAVVFNVTLPDEPPFVDTIEHLACAVRYAHRTADDHGGDPGRVTVVGHSMGAYTGALVALAGDDYSDQGCVIDDDESTDVRALVAYEGPYDHARNDDYPFDLASLERTDPELWTAIDPYQHLGGNPDLRVRLVQGVDGDVSPFDVHPEVAEQLSRALTEAGYDVELTMIDGAPHSYGTPGVPQWDAIVEQTRDVA